MKGFVLRSLLLLLILGQSARGMDGCFSLNLKIRAEMEAAASLNDQARIWWRETRLMLNAKAGRGEPVDPAALEASFRAGAEIQRALVGKASVLMNLWRSARDFYPVAPELRRSLTRSMEDTNEAAFNTDLRTSMLWTSRRLDHAQPMSAAEARAAENLLATLPRSLRGRGFSFHANVSLNGRPYRVIQVMAAGAEGTALIAAHEGRCVVIKRFMSEVSSAWVSRAVTLSRFLRSRGFETLEILDADPLQGSFASEFVRGETIGQLRERAAAGKLPAEELTRAETSLQRLMQRLEELQHDPEYLRQEFRRNTRKDIDTNRENMLYRNGRWVLIDF